jgi:predicted transposase YdaD
MEGREKGLMEGREKGLMEGREKGLMEGKKIGLLKGAAHVLLLQLREKFGSSLPGKVPEKLRSADEQTLNMWTIRILKADTLDDVFER